MQGRIAEITILVLVLLTTAAGCSRSAPARFYLLSESTGAEFKAPASASGPCMTLGIGPVELPDYLDRPQIVTQVSPHEIRLGDFDQWAEPLAKTIARVMAENLAKLLCVDAVFFHPSEPAGIDYQVLVTLTRFQGVPDGSVVLAAQWHIAEGGSRKVLAGKRATIRETLEGEGYALVAAQSRALARLSGEIAEALSAAPKP